MERLRETVRATLVEALAALERELAAERDREPVDRAPEGP